ncbi:putative ABC transport system permease protein [Lachnospiraceae bacterium PF1-21]
MYILKNAVKNLGRNKGRNILMAVIIFIIILTTVVSIIINTTTAEIINDYKTRFGAEVAIDLDYDKLAQSGQMGVDDITTSQYIEFGESDLLLSSVYEAKISGQLINMEVLDGDLSAGNGMSGAYGDGGVGGSEQDSSMPNMSLLASSRSDISDEFKSGARKIPDGEYPAGENECMISEQLAKLNNLSVGDTIQLKDMGQSPKTYTLTISGIFEDYTTDYLDDEEPFRLPWNNRHNEVFVSIDTITAMGMLENDNRALTAVYTLKAPSDLEAFKAELTAKGLPSYYKVTSDESGYKTVVGPVEEMSKITNTFLIVILILGGVILVVLSTMAIRERKYEIGVLRAMGMGKVKVAIGFLCESLIITSLCLILGLGVGALVSQPVADTLLESQIQIAEEAEFSGNVQQVGGTFSNLRERQRLSEVEISMSGEAILTIVIIALALGLVSSLSGILYITKYEPMKILSERN